MHPTFRAEVVVAQPASASELGQPRDSAETALRDSTGMAQRQPEIAGNSSETARESRDTPEIAHRQPETAERQLERLPRDHAETA